MPLVSWYNSTVPTPWHGIDDPLAIITGAGGSITSKVVNKDLFQVICDVAPESTSQVVGFALELSVFLAVHAPSGDPAPIEGLKACFVGFFAAHFVPSGVPSHPGHAVRMWSLLPQCQHSLSPPVGFPRVNRGRSNRPRRLKLRPRPGLLAGMLWG
jgi:hypothetical protein